MTVFLSHSMRERIAYHLHETETGEVLPSDDIANWEAYLRRANAILEVLKEPSTEMNDAGWLALRDAPQQGSIRSVEVDIETAKRCWRAMVEAALSV